MANSMIAVTADGTRFGCAGISLTETGVAVLDEGGSRLGFVPYGTLNYVTPCAGAVGSEDGTDNGDTMSVVATDGSEFSCAAISQASAGIATLAPSGARTGFVPYESLQYVLPPEKVGEELAADCSLPPGVAGAPGEEERDEEEGVWEDDDDADDSDESNADSGEDADESEGHDEESESDNDEPADDEEEDDIWEDAEESTEEVDPDADVIEEDLDGDADERSNDADGDIIEEDNEGPSTEPSHTEAEADAAAETTAADDADETSAEAETDTDAESKSDDEDEEREEAGASELKVEWSFGEYEE